MSRGLFTDEREPARDPLEPSRTGDASRIRVPMTGLDLPSTPEREVVVSRGRSYQLRDSEAEVLATIGAFRVVPVEDLRAIASSPDASAHDVRALAAQHLIELRTVEVNERQMFLATLTRRGLDVLETHRDAGSNRPQSFYAGLVKPRELAHDANLFRVFQAEAARIKREGGRVTRVVLDYELKREYQRFLNRPNRTEADTAANDVNAFAAAARLPIVKGHLELPDLRIEYETPDGRLEFRDVELVSEHYSRAQIAGKASAGFAMYRVGAGPGGSRHGATPFDPGHLKAV